MVVRITLNELIDGMNVSDATKTRYRTNINKVLREIRWRGRTLNFYFTKQTQILNHIFNSPLSTSTKKAYWIAFFSTLKQYNNRFSRNSRKRRSALNFYRVHMEQFRDINNFERGQ